MLSPGERIILDFIGVMESRGNYKAVFRGSNHDFSGMTIAQVMTFQKQRTDGGIASSALGKYQFIRATLKRLVGSTKVPTSALFTNEQQDEFGKALAEARGLETFFLEEVKPEVFANELAKEWASIPVCAPAKGKTIGASWYAGDGLNKSLTTPQKFVAMLNRALVAEKTARAGKPGYPAAE